MISKKAEQQASNFGEIGREELRQISDEKTHIKQIKDTIERALSVTDSVIALGKEIAFSNEGDSHGNSLKFREKKLHNMRDAKRYDA